MPPKKSTAPKKHGGLRPGAGRKPFEPSLQDRKTARVLTGYGVSQAGIANLILHPDGTPISKVILRKHFRVELDRGHPEFVAWLGDKLRAAIEGTPAVYDDAGNLLKEERPPSVSATIFGLKTQGKNEGWSERHEITGKDGQPIDHAHSFKDLEDLDDGALAIRYKAAIAPDPSDRR